MEPVAVNTAQVRAVTDLMKHLADTPEMRRMVPMMPQGGSVPPRCRRFIYGYALDHSEFPCYLLWPCRVQAEYWGYLALPEASHESSLFGRQ